MMRSWFASFPGVVLLFVALCWPLIFFSKEEGHYAGDETAFHLPAVRQIRAHWPQLDLNRDAFAAMPPGYHYALATLSLVTGTGRTTLRLVTWLVSLTALWVMWRWFPDAAGPIALSAILPLAASNFFVKSASWVVTDNAGLLAVALTLAVIVFEKRPRALWLGGLGAAAATFVRQLHVWTAAPLAWRAWQKWRASPDRATVWRAWPVLLPFVMLAILVSSWRGLVPPAWQEATRVTAAGSTASISYLLTVLFIFGLAYLIALAAEKNFIPGPLNAWVLVGAIAGLAIALAGPTNYNIQAGRWGGYLWWCAAHLPAPGERSLLFLVFAPLGGALLPLLVAQLAAQRGRALASLWLCAFLAWATTALANRLAFHRYFEPTTLLFLILWAALVMHGQPEAPRPRLWLLRVLAAGQAALTLITVYNPSLGPKMVLG